MEQTYIIEDLAEGRTLTACHGSEKEIVIPDGVEIIGLNAFEGNKLLTVVKIPNSVKKIGESSFKKCVNLASVGIPESVTEISSFAFYECKSLRSVVLPKGLRKIEWCVFDHCSNLSSIEIPEGVSIIGGHAFGECESLVSIRIPGSVKSIEVGAFENCNNLKLILLEEGIEKIEENAFAHCTSLTSVKIPGSVKNIGSAFLFCENLKEVEFAQGSLDTIYNTFQRCTSLTNVLLPESVKEIGNWSFCNCSNLSGLSIPEHVEVIGCGAFIGCNKQGSIILPRKIKKISPDAFDECNPAIEVCVYYHHDVLPKNKIEGFNNRYLTLLNNEGKKIGILYQLSSGKKRNLFVDFIQKLIQGKVEHLSGYDALFSTSDDLIIYKCKAAMCRLEHPLELLDNYTMVYTTYLRNNAKLIFPKLIRNGGIATISLLAGIDAIPKTEINTYIDLANEQSNLEILAFLMDYKNSRWEDQSWGLQELDLDKEIEAWDTQLVGNDDLMITKYQGKASTVIIPSTINGKKVTRIGGVLGSIRISIFSPYQERIQNVTIEEGIEVIERLSFLECRNLQSIKVPGSVKEIEDEAFRRCENLVIHAPKRSYAIKYAIKNDIKYEET